MALKKKNALFMRMHLTLSEYARQVAEERRLSCYAVSKRSGGKISKSTVNNIIAGRCGGITIERLKALAEGLGVSEEELLKIAMGVPDEGDGELSASKFADLFYKFQKLLYEDAREVSTLLEVVEHEIERRLAKRFMIDNSVIESKVGHSNKAE